MSRLFAGFQHLLPQHALSRLAGRLARSQRPWIRRPFIHGFARAYGVDLRDAELARPDDYSSFNDFFTRALRADARPLAEPVDALLSPADGQVSQAGRIDGDRLLQAKGTNYTLRSLTGQDCPEFHGGQFVTLYLAPRDYHRVHLPASGRLVATTAIPGQLYSVNARTEAAISDLFCRNERLVCRFETAHGAMLVILVGALIVASIETVWGGASSPYPIRSEQHWDIALERGAEIGRFLVGSTVIVCCEPERLALDARVQSGLRVRMGERLGLFTGHGPDDTRAAP